MNCPCAHCGNCGVLPCACKNGTTCHFLDFLGDLTACFDSVESAVGIPISFEKAHTYFTVAKLKDLKGTADSYKGKDIDFTLEFGTWKYKSADNKGGLWNLKEVGFLDSSESLHKTNLKIKVFETHTFTHSELIGEGEVSIFSLLQAGFHKEVTLALPLGKVDAKGVAQPSCLFEITTILKSHKAIPVAQASTPVAQQRASVGGRIKRESILYESTPDELTLKLKKEHFDIITEKHLKKEEIDQIITASIEDVDLLVGYQVELMSKSTGKSKGTWVIAGVKKFRFSATSYLLRNLAGEERWTVLQKNNVVNGKPVVLRRKVASF